MDNFTIRLPEDKKGIQRMRTVFRKQFFAFRKGNTVTITAYVIYFSDSNSEIEYHLFKTEEGEWSVDPGGKTSIKDEILISILQAILHKENVTAGQQEHDM